ncbi:MAG: metallophosphoesterase family protein [Rhodothermaceae bacterium]|nr:metallophosphoesterase family protein [Rhodothermaceae bacterium]
MRLAVLSDIHANLEALTTALRLAEEHGADTVVCLGDVVGYGPDPGPCIDLVRAHCEATVLGNHDEAVAFERGTQVLPRDGQVAAKRHREQLSDDHLDWLRGLPLQHEAYGCTFVHASPDNPADWARLDTFHAVQRQFDAFETPICFVGHSHIPAVASSSLGVLRVRRGHRFLADVGSVGQPRDRDPRLAFALYDTEAVTYEIVRAHYDVEKTAIRIAEADLPSSLAHRLRRGV